MPPELKNPGLKKRYCCVCVCLCAFASVCGCVCMHMLLRECVCMTKIMYHTFDRGDSRILQKGTEGTTGGVCMARQQDAHGPLNDVI